MWLAAISEALVVVAEMCISSTRFPHKNNFVYWVVHLTLDQQAVVLYMLVLWANNNTHQWLTVAVFEAE